MVVTGTAASLSVVVVVATGPRAVCEVALTLPVGTRLGEALQRCADLPPFTGLELATMPAGIWGRRANAQQRLHDGDRIELYRPLLVDPKVARRERFAQQGARATGLFARRRLGAKAGY